MNHSEYSTVFSRGGEIDPWRIYGIGEVLQLPQTRLWRVALVVNVHVCCSICAEFLVQRFIHYLMAQISSCAVKTGKQNVILWTMLSTSQHCFPVKNKINKKCEKLLNILNVSTLLDCNLYKIIYKLILDWFKSKTKN